MVEPGILTDGIQHAERDPDQNDQHHGGQGQLDGCREILSEILDDVAARDEGTAEVTPEEAPDIVHILQRQGPV